MSLIKKLLLEKTDIKTWRAYNPEKVPVHLEENQVHSFKTDLIKEKDRLCLRKDIELMEYDFDKGFNAFKKAQRVAKIRILQYTSYLVEGNFTTEGLYQIKKMLDRRR